MALVETLIDNFDDNSISAQWTTLFDTSVTVLEQNQRLEIFLPNTGGSYGNLIAATTYQMSDSIFKCQLVNAGNQALNTDVHPVEIRNGTDGCFWNISGNTIIAHTFVGGVDTDRGTNKAYVTATHKFFRLRESAGTMYWEWSTDGRGWNTHTSLSSASIFSMAAVTPRVLAGLNALGGTTTCIFDNVNYRTRIVVPGNNLRPHAFSPGLAR